MKDYSELKRLAEAATPGEWTSSENHDGRFWHIRSGNQAIGATHAASKKSVMAGTFEANAKFIAKANPSAVLELIDEVEILKYDCQVANSCVNAEKKESKRIIDENESLKKDAARYRWLRDESIDPGSVIDKKIGHSYVGGYPIWEYRAGKELDDSIDTAMTEVNNK